MTHLEVWGSPIGHSKSPQLHLAAYRALGLDWSFDRREVSGEAFAGEIASGGVRGLALTYPLKSRAFDAAKHRDRRAQLTGVANTLFFGGPEVAGFNTDVGGLARALVETGSGDARRVRIVGAGATTTSAIVALSELAAESVEVVARRPEAAAPLVALGERAGVSVSVAPIDAPSGSVDLTIATLPGGTELDPPVAARLGELGGTLFDVAYSPWPTSLAAAWPGAVHHGLAMLLHQAVIQVRIFVSGDPQLELPDEPQVIAAMRAALG
jgi:shikimate dehydrogenase